ncbi:alpha/beta hydrolase [Knoellia subterranea KCTC 19937]|uniref:Alpha/beta hydrolase n=1 Tax=Knoellia subterranea KCTC 19937 TaxID=1385521 RepID=A0A0A0JR42_9MICO|nr:alpha/beta hydrolase [Knoellia subterranea KCTC 19937]
MDRTVEGSDLEVAFEREGTGAPIVFAHGAALDSRSWGPQFAGLRDDFTVVAWDEPGVRASAPVPAGFALADFADALADVVRAVGLGPAHLAGLSWGGTVILETYRRHPDVVATLVLIDSYAGWSGSLPAAEVRARVEGVQAQLAAPAEEFDPTLPGLFGSEPTAEVVALMEAMARDVRPETLALELGIMAGTDLSGLLPHITVPTLLIWGELDARSPLWVADQFADGIEDSELVVIPGAGHMSPLEQPELVNAAIRDFCRRNATTSGR